MLSYIEERDTLIGPVEEPIDDRAVASRMRKRGHTEAEIVELLGYSPSPILPRIRPAPPRGRCDTPKP